MNDLKTTAYATNYIFILRALCSLILMVSLRNNGNGCSCGKCGTSVVKAYISRVNLAKEYTTLTLAVLVSYVK